MVKIKGVSYLRVNDAQSTISLSNLHLSVRVPKISWILAPSYLSVVESHHVYVEHLTCESSARLPHPAAAAVDDCWCSDPVLDVFYRRFCRQVFHHRTLVLFLPRIKLLWRATIRAAVTFSLILPHNVIIRLATQIISTNDIRAYIWLVLLPLRATNATCLNGVLVVTRPIRQVWTYCQ